MDKDDLVSGCKYPFRLENSEDEDDNDDDDNEDEESDDDANFNDLELPLEFPLFEPCEHSPALRGSPSNFFQSGSTRSNTDTADKHIEPSARFKIRRDDRGNKMKATLTFEPALYVYLNFILNFEHPW